VEAASLTLPFPARRTRRWLDGAASFAFVAALLSLALLAVGAVGGYRALIERSDSMAPVLRAGDLIVTRRAAAAETAVGDVVTFADPSRPGLLITHRVVARKVHRSRVAFVTRGDANTGVERWSIATDGSVGRLAWRVPKVGYAVSWLARPRVRVALVGVAGLILAAALLRRIWAT